LASLIALFSVALPFFLGAFALGPHLYDSHNNVDGKRVPPLSFKLFVGTSMSVTAFPVLARIITEKGLHHLNIGALAVACAALTDVVAWALLAVVLAVQESQADGGALEYKPVLVQLALIVVYIFVQFIVISPLMRFTVLRAFLKRSSLSANRLAWVLICMLLSAWLMHVIGFHAVRAPARATAARLRVLTSARYPFCIRRCWAPSSSASRFRAAARRPFCTPFSPRLSRLQSAFCFRSSSSSPACPLTSRS
jgi:Kef-type K+ transport system membrane component KefB